MQHDELIWEIISHGHCSFKSKVADESAFCRNPYNVTGLCNRSSCPLANSRYATIREIEGRCYLFMKTIERAHTPKNLWEKVKLSRNYEQALEQIDKHLQFWPKYMIHKNKQRLTKITQYLIRMRKLSKKVQPKLVRVHKKVEQREKRREKKALKAANIEKNIEKELLERLKSGTYGDIYNFPEVQYSSALKEAETDYETNRPQEEEGESDDDDAEEIEYVEDVDFDEEEDSDVEDIAYRTSLLDGDDEDDDDEDDYGFGGNDLDMYGDEDDEDDAADNDANHSDTSDQDVPSKRSSRTRGKAAKRRRGTLADDYAALVPSRPRIEIEYEHEEEQPQREVATNW